MRSVTPQLSSNTTRVAETQPEFVPVTVNRALDDMYPYDPALGWNCVVMAFKPTEEELHKLEQGEEVYISLLTFGQPQQGIRVEVGTEAMRQRVQPV